MQSTDKKRYHKFWLFIIMIGKIFYDEKLLKFLRIMQITHIKMIK